MYVGTHGTYMHMYNVCMQVGDGQAFDRGVGNTRHNEERYRFHVGVDGIFHEHTHHMLGTAETFWEAYVCWAAGTLERTCIHQIKHVRVTI